MVAQRAPRLPPPHRFSAPVPPPGPIALNIIKLLNRFDSLRKLVVNGKSSQMQMQMHRCKAVSVSFGNFPNGRIKGKMVRNLSKCGTSLSFVAIRGIHKARTTDFCVSLPSHHCRRPKRRSARLAQAGAWAGLGFPATIYSSFGVGVGVNRNVGKLG